MEISKELLELLSEEQQQLPIEQQAVILQTITESESKTYSDKADEIGRGLKCRVHPVVIVIPGTLERAVCYIKEPTFQQKISALDNANTLGVFQSAALLLDWTIISEHSDAVFLKDILPHHDACRLAAVNEASNMVQSYSNQFKKK